MEHYDVIVVGGGSAGIAAASGAARCGARTLLVERYGFLGGAATNALVLAYCGFYLPGSQPTPAVAGVGAELLAGLRAIGQPVEPRLSRNGNWIVMSDPEAVKLAGDRLIAASGAEVRLHCQLVDARREGNHVTEAVLADAAGLHHVSASAWVDASGEATLAARAGAALNPAVQAGTQQPASYPARLGGVAADAKVDREALSDAIRRLDIESPPALTRRDGGVLIPLPWPGQWWWTAVDLVTAGLHGQDLAHAERSGRERVHRGLEILRTQAGFEAAVLLATGPQLGLRETRRPLSREDLRGSDALTGRRLANGVGRACWPIEHHSAPGQATFTPLGGAGFFDIAADALRARNIDNLYLAGRVVGSDPQAYSSVRVMGTAFATGHAAGVLAATSVETGHPELGRARAALTAQDALL